MPSSKMWHLFIAMDLVGMAFWGRLRRLGRRGPLGACKMHTAALANPAVADVSYQPCQPAAHRCATAG